MIWSGLERAQLVHPGLQFPLATGNVLAQRYLVERLLGAGGMAVVAVATDLTQGQRVAIKMLLPEAARSEQVIKRFQREQRTLGQLTSEHAVKLLGGGTEGNYPYMVLEYLEGSDLSDLVKMQGALPMAEAVEYVLQACEAMAEAHSLQITHRDLKPGNLFLIRLPNGSACIKVLDFGISKVHEALRPGESTLTGTTALLGSPFYMSPEQLLSSRDVDPRTDIWSLGITLHELLSNTLPFGAKTTEKVCKRILNDSPTPLRQFRPDMPPALEAAILRCLQRRPAERFPKILDFASAIGEFAPPKVAERLLRAINDYSEPTNRMAARSSLPKLGHDEEELPQDRTARLPTVIRGGAAQAPSAGAQGRAAERPATPSVDGRAEAEAEFERTSALPSAADASGQYGALGTASPDSSGRYDAVAAAGAGAGAVAASAAERALAAASQRMPMATGADAPTLYRAFGATRGKLAVAIVVYGLVAFALGLGVGLLGRSEPAAPGPCVVVSAAASRPLPAPPTQAEQRPTQAEEPEPTVLDLDTARPASGPRSAPAAPAATGSSPSSLPTAAPTAAPAGTAAATSTPASKPPATVNTAAPGVTKPPDF